MCVFLSVYVCVCNCVSRSSCMYSPQPLPDACIIFLPFLYGWISHYRPSNLLLHIHFLSLFSLSLFPFVIIRWQKRCHLSASHWLLDIETGKGRGLPSRPCTSPHSFAWRPNGGVVGDGGCAPVSAPALYPFLSITVQVKQMIGFSQQGD